MSRINDLVLFLKDIIANKRLISSMAKNDFKIRYAGSYFGIVWAFVQPIITIMVYWFVFQVGFRAQSVGDYPFIVWLICGMIPWFFFSEAWASSSNCLIEYSYLVKKVVFRTSILPIVKIISSIFVHITFIGLIFAVFIVYRFPLKLTSVQVLYYLFSMVMLLLALSWISSALMVFLKDTSQILAIILQLGFWLTPIGWSEQIIPQEYAFWFKLNPIYYIIRGYRESFIDNIWFWAHPYQTLYFWGLVSIFFISGALFFRRLRPHFSDVL